MYAQFWSLGEKKPCGSAYQHTFECFRRSNHVTRICWHCWERKFRGVAIWTITMMVCAMLWMTLTRQCSGNLSFRRKLEGNYCFVWTGTFCVQVTDEWHQAWLWLLFDILLPFPPPSLLMQSLFFLFFLLIGSLRFWMQNGKGKDQHRQST